MACTTDSPFSSRHVYTTTTNNTQTQPYTGETLLHAAARSADKGAMLVIKQLVGPYGAWGGCDDKKTGGMGSTGCKGSGLTIDRHHRHRYPPTGVRVVDLTDRFGCTPLYYAALANRLPNVKVGGGGGLGLGIRDDMGGLLLTHAYTIQLIQPRHPTNNQPSCLWKSTGRTPCFKRATGTPRGRWRGRGRSWGAARTRRAAAAARAKARAWPSSWSWSRAWCVSRCVWGLESVVLAFRLSR